MHKKQSPIFCLTKDIDIKDFSEMLRWAECNKNTQTVLHLTEEEVNSYQENGLWSLIASITNNWLFGPDEDDWIFDYKVMEKIKRSLINSDFYNDKNVQKIVHILSYAIENKKPIVFYL